MEDIPAEPDFGSARASSFRLYAVYLSSVNFYPCFGASFSAGLRLFQALKLSQAIPLSPLAEAASSDASLGQTKNKRTEAEERNGRTGFFI